MLADDAALETVIVAGGLLDQPERPGLHIGMSTISVALAKQLAAVHARAGVPYISAPVFGRPDVAEAGKLNIVAAGAAALIVFFSYSRTATFLAAALLLFVSTLLLLQFRSRHRAQEWVLYTFLERLDMARRSAR